MHPMIAVAALRAAGITLRVEGTGIALCGQDYLLSSLWAVEGVLEALTAVRATPVEVLAVYVDAQAAADDVMEMAGPEVH